MREIYDFIFAQSESHPVKVLCELFKVSRSSYYAYINGQTYEQSDKRLHLANEVKKIFHFHKRRYGALRIWVELLSQGDKLSLYLVRQLMKEQGLAPKLRGTTKEFCT